MISQVEIVCLQNGSSVRSPRGSRDDRTKELVFQFAFLLIINFMLINNQSVCVWGLSADLLTVRLESTGFGDWIGCRSASQRAVLLMQFWSKRFRQITFPVREFRVHDSFVSLIISVETRAFLIERSLIGERLLL